MSNAIKVRAEDSALAMEKVIQQLGPDALILSTNHRDGMVEITATSGEDLPPAKVFHPKGKKATAPASGASSAAKSAANPMIAALAKAAAKPAARPTSGATPTPAPTPTSASSAPEAENAPSTFEELLKRRLDEDRVDALIRMAQQLADEGKAAQAVEAAQADPATQNTRDISANAGKDSGGQNRSYRRAAPQDPQAIGRANPDLTAANPDQIAPEQPEPIAERPPEFRSRAAARKPAARDLLTDLAAFDMVPPRLPDHIIEAIRDDLSYYDHSGSLIGLSKAVVGSILPEQPVECLGADRFWLAGPDMRQQALAAIRFAIGKLDAGEEKPRFFVIGSAARADAAFLAAKAELLGLNVSLVEESVGRNLPAATPGQGAQIILLPDDQACALEYAEKFNQPGDAGLFVLPTVFSRQVMENSFGPWGARDVQLLLCNLHGCEVSSEYVACLLQNKWQVAWTSSGEEILDNLVQADAVTVTDWMRAWLPAPVEDAAVPEMPLFRSTHSLARQ